MKMFSVSDKNKKQKSDILNFLVVCFLHIFLFFPSLSSLILWLRCFSFFSASFSKFFRSFDFLLDSSMKKKYLELNLIRFQSSSHRCDWRMKGQFWNYVTLHRRGRKIWKLFIIKGYIKGIEANFDYDELIENILEKSLMWTFWISPISSW